MKVFAYLIGMPAYIITGFLLIPFFFVTKWIYVKLFNTIDSLYLGLIESGILGTIFIYGMSYVFSWFNSYIPVFFVALVAISVFINNYQRFSTRPNKSLLLGYVIGESGGIIGFYMTYNQEHIFF